MKENEWVQVAAGTSVVHSADGDVVLRMAPVSGHYLRVEMQTVMAFNPWLRLSDIADGVTIYAWAEGGKIAGARVIGGTWWQRLSRFWRRLAWRG